MFLSFVEKFCSSCISFISGKLQLLERSSYLYLLCNLLSYFVTTKLNLLEVIERFCIIHKSTEGLQTYFKCWNENVIKSITISKSPTEKRNLRSKIKKKKVKTKGVCSSNATWKLLPWTSYQICAIKCLYWFYFIITVHIIGVKRSKQIRNI